jgi:hypothetical protein
MKFQLQSGSIRWDALGLIGKRRVADQFAALVELTGDKQPELIPWLKSGRCGLWNWPKTGRDCWKLSPGC